MGSLPREAHYDVHEIGKLIEAVDEQYGRMLNSYGYHTPGYLTARSAAVEALDKLQRRAEALQSTARRVQSNLEQDLRNNGIRR